VIGWDNAKTSEFGDREALEMLWTRERACDYFKTTFALSQRQQFAGVIA
jgi:hypothetical protein